MIYAIYMHVEAGRSTYATTLNAPMSICNPCNTLRALSPVIDTVFTHQMYAGKLMYGFHMAL